MSQDHSADFTEERYDQLLHSAQRQYRFEPFGTRTKIPHVLWRHDVDCSVHRALRLAEIEADRGLRATYFFMLHSEFYNLLEPVVFRAARKILSLGHYAGLHFDLAFYDLGQHDIAALEKKALLEKAVLENFLETSVCSVSFHNPEIGNALQYDQDIFAGMVSTYGRSLRDKYFYVSDSNGIWRHHRLPDVIEQASFRSLHVLTHPVWWTPEVMSPRERMNRAIDGRRKFVQDFYVAELKSRGRPDVG